MRLATPIVLLLALPSVAAAQDAPPSGLADVELARSHDCVGIIARADELEAKLQPYAVRSERLRAIAAAVAVEESTVVDSLHASDPVESEVRRWFAADAELARRFLQENDSALVKERAAAREGIKATLSAAIDSVAAQAQVVVTAAGSLPAEAGACDGAIFIRSAVLEACDTTPSPVCEEAASPKPGGRFRFVDTPESLWDVQEMRPWTTPTPLGVGPSGQLQGARTIGFARNGNLVLTLAFAPLLKSKQELTADQVGAFEAIDDSLGLVFDHPDIAVVPSLALRASAPQALAGESQYVLHFGTPDDADVIWAGPAGTGQAIQMTVPLGPEHLGRLRAGDPIRFTAVRRTDDGDVEMVFSLEFMTLNQAQATSTLFSYMGSGLSTDLSRLVPPSGR